MGFTERYIKITRENEIEVLKVLEKLGCKWENDFLPTEWLPSEHGSYDKGQCKECKEFRILKICYDKGLHFEYSPTNKEILLDELKSYLPKDNPYCKENIPDGKLNITKPNIIRRFSCLINKENGLGLKVIFEDCVYKIKHKNKYILDNNLNYSLKDFVELLNSMGFNLELRELGYISDVLNKMNKEAKLMSRCDGVIYTIVADNGRYCVIKNSYNSIFPVYFTEEQTNKYCNMLNEILEFDK